MDGKIKRISALVALTLLFANPLFADELRTRYFDETLKDIREIQQEMYNIPSEEVMRERAVREEKQRTKAANAVISSFGGGFEDIKIKPYKKSEEYTLDADTVSYDKATGIITASGNVTARNIFATVKAPKAEYNENTHIITAWSDEKQNITLYNAKNRYTGKFFEYNIMSNSGVFTDVSGVSESMYIKGKDVHFISAAEAVKEKTVSKKQMGKKALKNNSVIARWNDVTATSCDFAKPHYHLKTKRVTIIPNKATILKSPKLYFSNHLVFQYPFDYIVKSKGNQILPELTYTNSKGLGLGLNAQKYMGKWGVLHASVSYFTENILEASVSYRVELLKNLYLFGAVNRWYNSDDNDIRWRPEWGLDYSTESGWKGKLQFSDRELISNQMTIGETKRYNVSKKPEFSITSPWLLKNFQPAKIAFGATYGKYDDDKSDIGWTDRLALKLRLESNYKDFKLFKFFSPFYGGVYCYYNYWDDAGSKQKVLDAWAGLRYRIGAFNMSTRYFRRWVYDKSPFEFDAYEDNDYINQTIAFPLPIGPRYSKWIVALSGYYDYTQNRFPVLNYSLSYNKHCYTWMLWGRQEFYGTENLLGLVFYINAMPEKKFGVGSNYD